MFAVMAELEAMCATACARGMHAAARRDLEALHKRMAATSNSRTIAAIRLCSASRSRRAAAPS
jgi:hypothetical protein